MVSGVNGIEKSNRTAFLLCFAVLVAVGSLSLVFLVDTNAMEQQGISALWNGVSITMHYAFIAVSSLVIGKCISRLGVKSVIYLGFALLIVSSLCHIVTMDYRALFVYRCIQGIGEAFVFVSTETWITYASPERHLSRNLALYGLAFSIGFLFAPLGPFLYHSAGFAGVGGDMLTFVLSALGCAGALLWIGMATREPAGLNTQKIPLENWFSKIPVPSITAMIYGYLESCFIAQLYYFGKLIGLSTDQSNLLIALPLLGGMIAIIPTGIMADRWGRLRMLRIYSFIGAFSFLTVLFMPRDFTLIAVLIFIAGSTVGVFYTLGLSLIGESVPAEKLAYANGFFTFMYGIGTIIGPVISGGALLFLSGYGLFLLLGFLVLIFLVLTYYRFT